MPPADTLSIPRSWPGPVRAIVNKATMTANGNLPKFAADATGA